MRVPAVAVALFASLGVVIPFIRSFTWLLIAEVAQALGFGATDTLANTLIVWVHKRRVDPWMQVRILTYPMCLFCFKTTVWLCSGGACP